MRWADTAMRLFYALLLHLSELELAIARSTGRRAASIAQLAGDVERWKRAIWEIDARRLPI